MLARLPRLGVLLPALLCAGCPAGVATTDGGVERAEDAPSETAADDLADATDTVQGPDAQDAASDLRADTMDVAAADEEGLDAPLADASEMDAAVPRCVPGMSVACACEDGRMGAQTCRADGTFTTCRCTTPDASRPDVTLPPLGPRLLAPLSASRVTSQRPTMRWVLPTGLTRARVELCGDRACTRVLQQQEVTGTSWRPATMLGPGVIFWRVRGLSGDGSIAWTSATWEYLVGRRDAPTDTSFGSLKDFNNDGYDDVAISEDIARIDLRYRVSLFNGRLVEGSERPSQQLLQAADSRSIGAGDFNGDGVADLLVSAEYEGTLRVYHGRTGGLSEIPDTQLQIVRVGGRFSGRWQFAAGDFDGDGFGDVAILDDADVDRSTDRRQPFTLRIHRGGPGGVERMPSRSEEPPDEFLQYPDFFDILRSVGDVNADGYGDLLITYPSQRFTTEGLTDVGRAWLVMGGPTFPQATWHRIDPPTRAPRFGFTSAATGDLNGDGAADFAISSSDEVSIYLGRSGGVPITPARTIRNPGAPCFVAKESFGGNLGAAGDYNGDGLADLSVGAPCLPSLGGLFYREGMVFLYAGSSGGVVDSPTTLLGFALDSHFGAGVGGFGDMNGDGFEDLVVVQNSGILADGGYDTPPLFVYLGSPVGIDPTRRWTFRPTADGFGSRVIAQRLATSNQGGG